MKRTAAGLGIATLLAMWVTPPVGAQEMERGAWTGTVSPARAASFAVTFDVGETDGALSIVMSLPEAELSTAFIDLKLDGDELTFWLEPEPGGTRAECTLLRKEDGSFEGNCTGGSGMIEGTLTMRPPSGEDRS